MDISCDKCQSRFKIPDEKIPEGKTVALACPKCKHKITVTRPAPVEEEPAKKVETPPKEDDAFGFDVSDDDAFEDEDTAFDFAEEEGKTAIICETDPAIIEKLRAALEPMEYHITEVKTTRDALKQFRFRLFDLVVVNEMFDTRTPDSNGVLIYLSRLPMAERRNVYVTLISDRFRTMDSMAAFTKSVSLIINPKDIDSVEKLISSGISEHEFLYRIYHESLKATGRA